MEEKVTMDDYAAELEASFHKVQEDRKSVV